MRGMRDLRQAGRQLGIAAAGIALTIGLVALLLFRSHEDPPATPSNRDSAANTNTQQSAVGRESFVPQPDPAQSKQVTAEPLQATSLQLDDGASVKIPARAVAKAAPAKIVRLKNKPADSPLAQLRSGVYDITLGDGQVQPDAPLEVSIPVTTPPANVNQLSLARWDGQQWVAIPSRYDPRTRTISAGVLHLTPHGAVETTKYEPGPAHAELFREYGAPPEQQGPIRISTSPAVFPRGALVECTVANLENAGTVPARMIVRNTTGEALEFDDGNGKMRPGEGAAMLVNNGGKREMRFKLRVPHNAALGVRKLELTGDGETWRIRPITVVRPPVIIVDIDGMRQDIFYRALGTSQFPALSRISGGAEIGTPGVGSPVEMVGYGNGFALPGATTIFPTVTILGHAAIFSGADVRDYRLGGNQFFDRSVPKKYGFTGYDLFDTAQQSLGEFVVTGDALTNKLILAAPGITTVYQEAAKVYPGLTSVCFNNMYPGDRVKAARWEGMDMRDAIEFKPVSTVAGVDRRMARRAASMIRQHQNMPSEELGIITLYFCGLDHTGHDGTDPATLLDRHHTFLRDVVDPSLGEFVASMSEVMYKNSTFLFVADHGQTDLDAAKQEGLSPALRCFTVSRSNPTIHKFEDLLYEFGYLTDDSVLPVNLATGVLSVNGGMAHIYLRRCKDQIAPAPRGVRPSAVDARMEPNKFENWGAPPRRDQVMSVAQRFWSWNRGEFKPEGNWTQPDDPKEYRNSLELVLLRDCDGVAAGDWAEYRKRPYHVYMGMGMTKPLFDFLRTEEGKKVLVRNGWKADDRDAEFVADRIERMNGPLSGDVVLLPLYPYFYCEYAPLHGEHGSINRQDFEIPFAVFKPAATKDDLTWIRQAIERGVKLDPPGVTGPKKNRAANTDVKATVINLLATRPDEALIAAKPMMRLYPRGEIIGEKIDDKKGMGDSVVLEEGRKGEQIEAGESLCIDGMLNVPDTEIGAEGAPVTVQYLGKTWHSRTRAPGRPWVETGEFSLELPLRRGVQELTITIPYHGQPISRTVRVEFRPPAKKVAAMENGISVNGVSIADLGKRMEEELKSLEAGLASANKGNDPNWIDQAVHRKQLGGLIYLAANMPYTLGLYTKAWQPEKGLELWKAGREKHAALWGGDPSATLSDALTLDKAMKIERYFVSGQRALHCAVANAQWQAGDLDGAYATLKGVDALAAIAYSKKWGTPQSFEVGHILAHNRMQAGDLAGAVKHWEQYSNRIYEQIRQEEGDNHRRRIQLPVWYPSQKEVEALGR